MDWLKARSFSRAGSHHRSPQRLRVHHLGVVCIGGGGSRFGLGLSGGGSGISVRSAAVVVAA